MLPGDPPPHLNSFLFFLMFCTVLVAFVYPTTPMIILAFSIIVIINAVLIQK